MTNQITEEKILAASYKECAVGLDKCERKWFKEFYSYSEWKDHKLYQIVIRYWSFKEYSTEAPTFYDAKVCFSYPNSATAWITYRANTIEEIEEFFSNMFHKTGAIACDKNMTNP